MTDGTYDVIVLGAGSTGENVAGRIAGAGLAVVVVEPELVGGECSYWACIPSKALLRPPAALAAARAVDGARQAVTGDLDVAAVLARRTRFTGGWRDDSGQVEWLGKAHVDLIRGHGRLTGERRVAVRTLDGGEQTLTARHAVVVATGSEPAIPDVPGMERAVVWTSREATSASRPPERLAVIGGGVVACEMATAWSALGSHVTMLVRGDGLLRGLEPFACEAVTDALRTAGVQVRTGAAVTRIRRLSHAAPVEIWFDAADAGREGPVADGPDRARPADLAADELLVATGRVARTGDIGLEAVGLEPGGWLAVDDTCRVTAVADGWLYAAGDVNHRNLLTHMGKYQGRICADAIVARVRGEFEPAGGPGTDGAPAPWSRWAASADGVGAPQVIFTDPEVAQVGLTLDRARERGLRVRAVDYEIGNVAGASLLADGYRGRARAVVDEDRRVLVGVTFVGPAVAELLHAATVAVVAGVPLDRLWHAVPVFPTVSEVWLRLLEAYGL